MQKLGLLGGALIFQREDQFPEGAGSTDKMEEEDTENVLSCAVFPFARILFNHFIFSSSFCTLVLIVHYFLKHKNIGSPFGLTCMFTISEEY